MQLFECQNCGQTLHFENRTCERCGHRLGYIAARQVLAALRPQGEDAGTRSTSPGRPTDSAATPSTTPATGSSLRAGRPSARPAGTTAPSPTCRCPRTSNAGAASRTPSTGSFYSLLQLRLPLATRAEDPEGLAFDMLADPLDPFAPKVLTGHASGVVTINIAEADDAERESRRQGMGEVYRTLLGHFRHEVGHYYWDRLVRDGGEQVLEAFRALFGDEREDYAEALKRHYENGPASDWQRALHLALCLLPSLGGLRRNLGPLPAHRGHARDRRRLRPAAPAGRGAGRRPVHAHRLRLLRGREASRP